MGLQDLKKRHKFADQPYRTSLNFKLVLVFQFWRAPEKALGDILIQTSHHRILAKLNNKAVLHFLAECGIPSVDDFEVVMFG